MTNNFKPRLLRLRDAPRYLGMDRHRFNTDVRSYVTEIKIGNNGVAFDILELDAWVDSYKQHFGRPPTKQQLDVWQTNKQINSVNIKATCTAEQMKRIKRESTNDNFAKALALTLPQKCK